MLRNLSPEEDQYLHRESRCPFCGCDKIIEGPSGGASQNMYCGNTVSCQARFNFTPMDVELIQSSVIDFEKWVCNRGNGAIPRKEPKFSKDQILAKFGVGKRHWWQRA